MAPRIGQERLRTLLFAGALGVVLLVVVQRGFVELPDWFDGGEDDPAPRGDVTYEGQQAKTASEDLLVDIGNGEAVVSVKAKQNHDRSGSILNGDFQSTNGTSSVADPEDGDLPAALDVAVDYCADGLITTVVTPPTEEGEEPTRTIRFEMGDLVVCDTTLEHTVANDSAFKQDDTPNDFHGEFVSFVAGAVETAAAAAPCPEDELARFGEAEVVDFLEGQLAVRYEVDRSDVTVVPGRPGTTDADIRTELRDRLESYANMEDPDDPDRTYEALDIQYLSSDETAVEDSCYRDPGGRDLETLGDVEPPAPG